MPVRSLRSPVLTWPDRDAAYTALRHRAADLCRSRPDVVRAGSFGSCARGDLLVNTVEEWERLVAEGAPFVRRIGSEVVWV